MQLYQTEEIIKAAIIGAAFGGFVMLYNYAMLEGNILAWYHDLLSKKKWKVGKKKVKNFLHRYKINNILGLCPVCFGFWFCPHYLVHEWIDKIVMVGFAEIVLVFYYIALLFYEK